MWYVRVALFYFIHLEFEFEFEVVAAVVAAVAQSLTFEVLFETPPYTLYVLVQSINGR